VFFFTNHLNSLKDFLWENFYDLSSDVGFTLEKVVIKGNKNLPESEIVNALNADVGTSLFSLDLEKVHSRIKNLSWVEYASVRRILPNIIEVDITERKPIAIWQNNMKLALIDSEGSIISTKNIQKFSGLLHVVGKDANLHADSLYEHLKASPEILENIISAVRYGERRWNLILKQDITVKMPESGFSEALDYLDKMAKQKKLFGQKYKMLDLRDSNKYYI
jgi:cell division protein FtsQ